MLTFVRVVGVLHEEVEGYRNVAGVSAERLVYIHRVEEVTGTTRVIMLTIQDEIA